MKFICLALLVNMSVSLATVQDNFFEDNSTKFIQVTKLNDDSTLLAGCEVQPYNKEYATCSNIVRLKKEAFRQMRSCEQRWMAANGLLTLGAGAGTIASGAGIVMSFGTATPLLGGAFLMAGMGTLSAGMHLMEAYDKYYVFDQNNRDDIDWTSTNTDYDSFVNNLKESVDAKLDENFLNCNVADLTISVSQESYEIRLSSKQLEMLK